MSKHLQKKSYTYKIFCRNKRMLVLQKLSKSLITHLSRRTSLSVLSSTVKIPIDSQETKADDDTTTSRKTKSSIAGDEAAKLIASIRNIGILAHIDAGKTTTTERMLYYSGKTRTLGEVHHGNTVTDYLTQERERGITICSSAVTFPWKGHRINLLDTPGHIDFTMEVEQSLSAVDGVIVVLDGTAGVEAQTMTVWSQADRHRLPKIIFINKMDRLDANFEDCIQDIKTKLDIVPLRLQLPIKNGIIDIINLQKITWKADSLGREFNMTPLEGDILNDINKKRNELIDILCETDDKLAEIVITNNSYEKITKDILNKSIKQATCDQRIVPILLGSAYKNIAVQPLMDSILNYLPAPNERNQLYDCFGNDFVGKVFKIVHDKQKGPLTLVRIFKGEMKKNMRLVTIKGTAEVAQRIYEPLADEYKETNSIGSGDVTVCSGLKTTVTGDLLISSVTSIKNAQKKLQEMLGKNFKTTKDDNDDDLKLINEMLSLHPQIPDAVYFCSIEPPSLSYQNSLENALKQLQREDPSLRVKYDEVTGQTVLGGMGELHIEIIKSRILTEFKIDADIGPLQIAYRETIDTNQEGTWNVEKEIAGSKQHVTITMSVVKNNKEMFSLDNNPDNIANLNLIRPRVLQMIKKGALGAFERGPRVGGQVVDVQIKLHNVVIGRGTADSFVMAASAQCVQKILSEAGTRLLEPFMSIQIVVPSERVSVILGDLGRRRAMIKDVKPKGERNKLIDLSAPLAELTGYSSVLRTISSGTASMTMQPNGYSKMQPQEEIVAVRKIQGLE